MKPAIGLFAKPPVAGEVKTRLQPLLSPEEGAELYRAFLADLAGTLASSDRWEWVVFSTDPGRQETLWDKTVPRPLGFRLQTGRDLGERIPGAFEGLFAEGRPAGILLGSDHPSLAREILDDAVEALEAADVVLGPSLDGGYYLVGMKTPHPALFRDIPWSTPEVLEKTLERVKAAGLTHRLLRPWYDVDTPEDLRFLRVHLQGLIWNGRPAGSCPRTQAILARISGRE
jgi:rSAM/selenodomain-associated transferase 1